MNKIACIVVTYNRLELLQKCIQALRVQSYSDFDIIVVNNGSTDGTLSWLNEQNDIKIIDQENMGGSGGFHNGVQYAYSSGYDWFWIMDDDGIPEIECLRLLLNEAEKGFHYLAPNLLDFKGQYHFPQFKDIRYLDIVNHCGGPFNAILLSRTLIKYVGLPNRLFFIWGDEYEFVNRVKNAGFIIAMCLKAIHRHKRTEECGIPTNRLNYKYRNLVWITRLDDNKKRLDLPIICLMLFLRAIKQELLKLKLYRFIIIIRAIFLGLNYDICKLREGGRLVDNTD